MTASDDSRDRYGDRILVDGRLGNRRFGEGWDLRGFKRNPVVLASHDYSQLPLGQVSKLWGDITIGGRKRLRARLEFARSNPAAEIALGLFREGALRAVSVGFKPKREDIYQPGSEKERSELGVGARGVIFGTSELWEISAVAVPANPGAVVEGLSCDARRGLCKLADAAESMGAGEAAYTIRSAVQPALRRSVSVRRPDLNASARRLNAAIDRVRAAFCDDDEADLFGFGSDFEEYTPGTLSALRHLNATLRSL